MPVYSSFHEHLKYNNLGRGGGTGPLTKYLTKIKGGGGCLLHFPNLRPAQLTKKLLTIVSASSILAGSRSLEPFS